eukprot:4115340-Ditylum_brightwellii.AAC.1
MAELETGICPACQEIKKNICLWTLFKSRSTVQQRLCHGQKTMPVKTKSAMTLIKQQKHLQIDH